MAGEGGCLVEIADDDRERMFGLMYRREMARDAGMLFDFQQEQPESFWMENTRIPLSIAYVDQVGTIHAPALSTLDATEVEAHPVRCPHEATAQKMQELIERTKKKGDSVGGAIRCVVTAAPAGLGEPVFGRLDADLAGALMGINAVKGVEIGAGFSSVEQRGSEHRDALTPEGFVGNNAGGILGGISSGQTITASIALKPTSSIRIPGDSIDVEGNPAEIVTTGRHDPCVGIRAVPIAEAMVAIVLMDHTLRQRAQNADVVSPTPAIPAAAP